MTQFQGVDGSQTSLEPGSGQNPLNVLWLCPGEGLVPPRGLPELCSAGRTEGMERGDCSYCCCKFNTI